MKVFSFFQLLSAEKKLFFFPEMGMKVFEKREYGILPCSQCVVPLSGGGH